MKPRFLLVCSVGGMLGEIPPMLYTSIKQAHEFVCTCDWNGDDDDCRLYEIEGDELIGLLRFPELTDPTFFETARPANWHPSVRRELEEYQGHPKE